MADCLKRLLDLIPVCIISGGNFEQFATQVVSRLPAGTNLADLHLMPTCGTRYLRYANDWQQIYAHDLSATEKSAAIAAITECAQQAHLWEPDEKIAGERIEDRGSQITYSALGQRAQVADKKAWDPTGAKRERLRSLIAERLPDLEVRAGGSTSIDITRQGIDKAYGMTQLSRMTGIKLTDILFIGDRLMPGGNDYPVRALGVATHEVSDPQDTLNYLEELMLQLEAAKENHDDR